MSLGQTRLEMFGHNGQRKPNTVNELKHLIPTVKYGGGVVTLWVCFAAMVPGQLAVFELIMTYSKYQRILKSKGMQFVQQLKLG